MIQCTGVKHRFHREGDWVLNNIDFEVTAGESVAVVGESGAGKSTLGRILLGLNPPTEGEYRFDGRDVYQMEARERREWRPKVQAVMQNPRASLNPRLPIALSLTEPLDLAETLSRKQRQMRASALLEQVGLPAELVSRYPAQLSGGQRQRVAIARGISTSPEVLVLDEPLSALDVSARAQILQLLARLRHENDLTYVFITHDLTTVSELCSRLYVLQSGNLVEKLSTEAMLRGPEHFYTQRLLGSVLTLDSPSLRNDPAQGSTTEKTI